MLFMFIMAIGGLLPFAMLTMIWPPFGYVVALAATYGFGWLGAEFGGVVGAVIMGAGGAFIGLGFKFGLEQIRNEVRAEYRPATAALRRQWHDLRRQWASVRHPTS